MAHTPGPWEVERFVDQVQVAAFSNDGNRILCFRGESDNTDDDALLIAAAPDLLRAAREAVIQIEYLHEKFKKTGSGESILHLIRSAIDKATGE